MDSNIRKSAIVCGEGGDGNKQYQRNRSNFVGLSLFEKMTYASAGGGFCMFFMSIGGYLLFVYTDVFHLNPVTAANIFLFTRLWDAVNDPIMGLIVDKRPFQKKGKGVYRPWILLSVPCLVITFTLCFTMPSFISSEGGKTAWAIVMYVLYTMSQTLGQVPYGSLSNAITTDSEERGSLGAYRNLGENIGNLVVQMIILTLVSFWGKAGGSTGIGWTGAALTIALIASVFLLLCYKFVNERGVMEQHPSNGIKDSFSMLLKNRPVMCLAAALFIAAIIINFRFAYAMYYIRNYVGGNEKMVTTVNSLQTAVAIIAFWPVNLMFKKMEKRSMMIMCGVLFIVNGALFLAARQNYILILLSSALFGFLMTFSFSIVWGTIPDGVEYGLWKTGICSPAFLFAVVTFAQKCGIGIASWLAGISLNSVGYSAGAVLSQSSLKGLYLWNGGVLIIGGAVFLAVVIPYNLSKKLYKRIVIELDKKESY